MRRSISLNGSWLFTKQQVSDAAARVMDSDGWEPVEVPHTWNAIDGANGFDFYKGACWYKREFSIDRSASGNRVFIEFKGSNSITDVYINSTYLGQHRGGYSTFRFDITEHVSYGAANLVSVKVDNTVVDDVYPQMADFTFFGGIYRDVSLVIVNPVHLDMMDYGSQGVYVIQEQVSPEQAVLTIRTRVVNSLDVQKKVRLWADLIDADGCTEAYTAKEVVLEAGETLEVDMPLTVCQPTLWNGRSNPYLYEARISIHSFNDTLDMLSIPVGLRYFEVDAEQGFFLNGESHPLRGVSRHQDRKDMGWAISKREHEEDMALIKEIGANTIRLAHYQHDPYFYDLCDQEGMVLWAEIPFISVMSKNELEGINAKQQMIELIRQNFNHPSICFWGIQNEIQISGERPELRKLVGELNELTKKEDPTRLTTMANVMFVPDNDDYNRVTDVVGYNKYYGWYQGKVEDFAGWIDGFHQTNPTIKLGISEYGAEGIIEYHNDDPQVKDYSEEYHALFHEKVWRIFQARPFLWSTYVWNMFDFGANIRDEGGVKGRNNKGLVTYDRQIKKDAFYMYKANWSDEKFAHIAGKRYIDRPNEAISIKVYSNCDEVSLYVNGVQHQTAASDNRIFLFDHVPLQEGLNTVHVISNDHGINAEDMALFNRTNEPNPSYEAPEDKGGIVSNWFQLPEEEDIEMEELVITDDVFSTRCTIREMMNHPEARLIVEKYLGANFVDNPMYEMAAGMSMELIAGMASEVFTDKVMYRINKELTTISKA
jgi:Beta-galactosidase/beta-glucuronidase